MERTTKDLIEEILSDEKSKNLLNLIFISYISADTLVSLEAIEKSEKFMDEFEEAIQETDKLSEEEKKSWFEKIEEGRSIISRDKNDIQQS